MPLYDDSCTYCTNVCEEDTLYGPYCGDNILNSPPEECDGTEGVGHHQNCTNDCTVIDLTYCGDNIMQQPNDEGTGGLLNDGNESCDGSAPENYNCLANCILEYNPPCDNLTYYDPYHYNSTTQWIDTVSTIAILTETGEDICGDTNRTFYNNNWIADNNFYCESYENCQTWTTSGYTDSGWETYTEPFSGGNESCHVIEYYSMDSSGNKGNINWDCVYVDKTAPITNKSYEGPFYADGVSEWISLSTNITLTAEDPQPHPSSVNDTSYRVTLVDDENCRQDDLCQNAIGKGVWEIYDELFSIPEESCHLIEYFSTDNVNKTETIKKQCIFVDNSTPETIKIVGNPNTYCDNSTGVCEWEWKITTMTPITLSCNDTGPHPVGHSKVYWRTWWDKTGNWTNWLEADEGTEIYIGGECLHKLEFYCTDALGYKSESDIEWIKVEGTSFNITLNKKWNLISVPFVLLNNSIYNIFKDIEGQIDSVWTFNGTDWFVYTPGPAPDTLTELFPGWGYWVYANDDALLTIGGNLFSPATTPPSKIILAGWNLIGYWGTEGEITYAGPVGSGKSAYCELYSLGEDLFDKSFSSLWTWWQPYLDPLVVLALDDHMDTGAGYWVYTTHEGFFVPPTVCNS